MPRRIVPHRSLWLRAVAVLAGFGGITAVALFFSIDHFVSQRFRALHDERVTRIVDQIRDAAEREARQLAGIASLIAGDADLVNSTYYHRHLEGERDHPQAAVERIARAFGFGSVSLWTPEGQLIAGTGEPLMFVTTGSDRGPADPAQFRVVGNRIWIVAPTALTYNDNPLAVVQLARPLDRPDIGSDIAPSTPAPASKSVRVVLDEAAVPPALLEVAVPDTVADAVAGIKRILGVVMAVFGVLMTAGIAYGLRRVFRPVLGVIDAALAVGRGEFGRKVTSPQSSGEVGELVSAFNQMSDGIVRLRELERQVQHQEQLSAIGRAAARVAHDLNNPLTVISTTADLAVRRTDLDAGLSSDMRLIQHHCERARSTIEALLHYGRPVRLRLSALDLAEACREIVVAWARRHANVEAEFIEAEAAIVVDADRLQLERMIENLLDNARSMSNRISVTLSRAAEWSSIAVADQGPGFSADAQAHLFEPFFTTHAGGTGLGLASALAIARAHGGDIVIAAGPPAVVTIRLPVARDAPQPKR